MHYTVCSECSERAMYSVERADVCEACGYYFYYRDAYAPGDTNSEGYREDNKSDNWRR